MNIVSQWLISILSTTHLFIRLNDTSWSLQCIAVANSLPDEKQKYTAKARGDEGWVTGGGWGQPTPTLRYPLRPLPPRYNQPGENNPVFLRLNYPYTEGAQWSTNCLKKSYFDLIILQIINIITTIELHVLCPPISNNGSNTIDKTLV